MVTSFRSGRWAVAVIALACGMSLASAPAAMAQSDIRLLADPWDEEAGDVAYELSTRLRFFESAESEAVTGGTAFDPADGDVRLQRYDADARVGIKLIDNYRGAFGFSFSALRFKGGLSGGEPLDLVDASFGVGAPVARLGEWGMGVTLGGGYASNTGLDRGEAWYGEGNLLVAREFDSGDVLAFGLNYDGNRGIFPDIPLPGFVYHRRWRDDLVVSLGFPATIVEWTPTDKLTVELEYTLPLNADLEVRYQFVTCWELYGGFYNEFDAFWVEGQPRQDRLFFSQRVVEVGFNYEPTDFARVSIGGGVAFDQELETGFDIRETDDVAELDSALFGSVSVEISY